MADIDLPVFPFRPNWAEGVTERLSFLSDVLRSATGAEQRRKLRNTPRRLIEADFLLHGPERTFFDLFMNRLGGGQVMAPLFWDIHVLRTPAVAGFTDRFDFDTTDREFAPGLAILIHKTAIQFEVVTISAVDVGGVDLADEVVGNWPLGTILMPLRRAYIDDQGSPSHITASVATVSVQIGFIGAQKWDASVDESPIYLGHSVFTEEPNWVDALDMALDRDTIRLDNTTGIPYQHDTLGRTLVGQSHRWWLNGRQALSEFRSLLYRHAGRVGTFWLPTFKADFKLTAAVSSGSSQITVANVGFGYTGGPTSGREYIAIRHSAGTIYRKVLSVIPGTSAATERLNLDSAVGLDLSPGQVRKISFMDTARFDTDDFEIQHHAGLDSLAECSAIFRTFKDTRTAPTPIDMPIPEAVMTEDSCGAADNSCYHLPNTWLQRAVMNFQPGVSGGPPLTIPSLGNANLDQAGPVFPNGKQYTASQDIISSMSGAPNYDIGDGLGLLNVWRDNPYEDGTPGLPITGLRIRVADDGSVISLEYYFFWSFTEGRFGESHQFGFGGTYPGVASFYMERRDGTILATGGEFGSSPLQANYYHIYPASYYMDL